MSREAFTGLRKMSETGVGVSSLGTRLREAVTDAL
jgi:hypothetical protein